MFKVYVFSFVGGGPNFLEGVEKLVPGGTNFGGSIFTMTDPSVSTEPVTGAILTSASAVSNIGAGGGGGGEAAAPPESLSQ